MTQKITFKLIGNQHKSDLVTFGEFVRFCESVEKCLRRAESLEAKAGPPIEYTIVDLKCASATVVLEPQKPKSKRQDTRKAVLGFFRNTIQRIERGQVDPRLGVDDLAVFKELAAPLKNSSDAKVYIGRTRITNQYLKNIDKLLEGGFTTEGTVTGKLERINTHDDKNEFVLYPEAGGRAITCHFHESLFTKVRNGLSKYVTAMGTLFYQDGKLHPHRANIRSLTPHPSDKDLPTLHEVAELGSWDTGGLSPVEFVRSIRDE